MKLRGTSDGEPVPSRPRGTDDRLTLTSGMSGSGGSGSSNSLQMPVYTSAYPDRSSISRRSSSSSVNKDDRVSIFPFKKQKRGGERQGCNKCYGALCCAVLWLMFMSLCHCGFRCLILT